MEELQFNSLIDVYMAILKGAINPEEYYLVADSGDMKIYAYGEGPTLLNTYEDDAFDFVAAILGIQREHP